MIDRGNSVLFVKQLDFLLLGLDQLVNTFNFIRAYLPPDQAGSFTIFLIVCDQGYQGPQSSMNSAADFSSIANVDVFCLNAAEDTAEVVAGHFVRPGFRIICLSQRLFGGPALSLPIEWRAPDQSIFRYRSGNDVTIACYNFALRQGAEVADELAQKGFGSDLFHVNFLPNADLTPLAQSCKRTGKVIVIDDSKTVTKFADMLLSSLLAERADVSALLLTRRGCANRDYGVSEDRFSFDRGAVIPFCERA
jgi:pyruvate dehydrogenase E1 component beta subunit